VSATGQTLTSTRLDVGPVEDMTALARLVVERYGYTSECRLHLFPLTENWTYRVAERGREPAILRLYRPASRQLEEIVSELAWIRALRRDDPTLVPDVIALPDGGHLLEFVREPLPPCFGVMFSYEPGHEPADDELAEWFPRLGAVTARLHRHAQAWQPPAAFTRIRWDVDTTLGGRPHWGSWTASVDGAEERRQLGRAADLVLERLREFGTGPERFGLVHADLRLANILIDGERLTVIDFDDCGESWYLYDIGTALGFNQARADIDELVAAWVAGYREVAPLAEADEREIPTFIMLRRLLEHAYIGLRSETELAHQLHEAGFTAESCIVAERYLSRFG
jgi:Ser/Thr protein kinase RdoA (MazF antagonist)